MTTYNKKNMHDTYAHIISSSSDEGEEEGEEEGEGEEEEEYKKYILFNFVVVVIVGVPAV